MLKYRGARHLIPYIPISHPPFLTLRPPTLTTPSPSFHKITLPVIRAQAVKARPNAILNSALTALLLVSVLDILIIRVIGRGAA